MDDRRANETLVSAAYAALAWSDIDAFVGHLHPEARFYYPESIRFGGIYSGHSQIRQGLKWEAETWVDANTRLEQITSWDDRVVAYLSVCGKSPATGKSFSFPLAETWQIKDGRVMERRSFFWDTHRMRECTEA